jgi:spore coat protein CotH
METTERTNRSIADATLPVYELEMEKGALAAWQREADSNEKHPAKFTANGIVYEHVEVRYRGEWARSWPKKPVKIFFEREQPFEGHHSLNLNSAWRDPAFVRETLAYHVYAACGVPASRSRLVRLHLNGQFHGLYAEVEQVDKTQLRWHGLRGSELFKSTSDENEADERDLGSEARFATHYENETQTTNGLRPLQRFCQELAGATDTLEFFTRHVALDAYINYLAATALIQHWDGYNKNHFVVYDRLGSGKWLIMPWDLDRTFGDHWNGAFNRADLPLLLGTRRWPSVTGWNRLQDRFFSEPELRRRFGQRLDNLLADTFTPEKLFPVLDQLEASLAEAAVLDRDRWGGPRVSLHTGIAGVKQFIEQRRAFLQRELRRLN